MLQVERLEEREERLLACREERQRACVGEKLTDPIKPNLYFLIPLSVSHINLIQRKDTLCSRNNLEKSFCSRH